MGKITFENTMEDPHWDKWRIKSYGSPIGGSWITSEGGRYFVGVRSRALFAQVKDCQLEDCLFTLATADTSREAMELAKEIFKNKTSLRDRAFESALDFFSDQEGDHFLTPEKCSEIFYSIHHSVRYHRYFLKISD